MWLVRIDILCFKECDPRRMSSGFAKVSDRSVEIPEPSSNSAVSYIADIARAVLQADGVGADVGPWVKRELQRTASACHRVSPLAVHVRKAAIPAWGRHSEDKKYCKTMSEPSPFLRLG